MAANEPVLWWRDRERLFVDVDGIVVEARWLKFEEQLATLQFGSYCVERESSRSGTPTNDPTWRDERLSVHEEDPLLDECLW